MVVEIRCPSLHDEIRCGKRERDGAVGRTKMRLEKSNEAGREGMSLERW